MVRFLRRWNGRIVSLQIGGKIHHGGRVEVKMVSSKENKGLYTKTAERKYYYITYSGKRIPIYHSGNKRVVEQDGRLVQLITEAQIE